MVTGRVMIVMRTSETILLPVFADNGGVFKARSQNHATRGARQVDDSHDTRTELPVDKRPAEQVQVCVVRCFKSCDHNMS